MGPMYYIGLDIHKQKISYCVKDVLGKIHAEGWIPATRFDLDRWMKALPQPWSAAMEATTQVAIEFLCLSPYCGSVPVHHTHQSPQLKMQSAEARVVIYAYKQLDEVEAGDLGI